MDKRKWSLGFKDGSGHCRGRHQKTAITAYCKHAEIELVVMHVYPSEHYDCEELAKAIVASHNKALTQQPEPKEGLEWFSS